MAKLDEQSLKNLQHALDHCSAPVILSCYQNNDERLAKNLEGTIGFFDWRLNGKISYLVKCNALKAGELTFIPANNKLGRASLLIYTKEKSNANMQTIIKALKGLKVDSVSVAKSTFPEALLQNLESSFKKESIQWQTLEQYETNG